MQIFFLDRNPYICARYYGDKHVSKILIEVAQLMSTAHHVLSGEFDENNKPFSKLASANGMYKPTHINHPCNIWVRENTANYDWAWELSNALSLEFIIRRKKPHKTNNLITNLRKYPKNINKAKKYSDPPLAMPDEFKCEDPVKSYRAYYQLKFDQGIVTYNWSPDRGIPEWIIQTQI